MVLSSDHAGMSPATRPYSRHRAPRSTGQSCSFTLSRMTRRKASTKRFAEGGTPSRAAIARIEPMLLSSTEGAASGLKPGHCESVMPKRLLTSPGRSGAGAWPVGFNTELTASALLLLVL